MASTKQYAWHPRAIDLHCGGITPQVAGDELARIQQQCDGRGFRQAIVDEARDPASPLHAWSGWTWDVVKAAQKCWREEAGDLIRVVRVVDAAGNKEPAFVHVQVAPVAPAAATHGGIGAWQARQGLDTYQTLDDVAADPIKFASALHQVRLQMDILNEYLVELELAGVKAGIVVQHTQMVQTLKTTMGSMQKTVKELEDALT